ncbi:MULTISPECIES: 8-amino-7-oxononanoate synthase [Lysobacter]|jgi:8-amino-7-oxononanoate synthase|uniref:8-amino-7-oxononanoate synthase n=1 Tax=Lysobacter gummosus TaxID=262324 RepID=A0ABY3XDK4_9GAMM|nr:MULTISPECIES: 8-amino-7-oxononanoate synthase [Lysobacter]ALN94159.1 8-amino-7-oxononanoate synthase [Lysobacter gummosus]UJB19318.1 8-amino-7-oxononanoate synthase [Lysobacter capsici]UJQ26957.1 8-amino-7-oxononanoate synthase [Lysobacter gummosus]UNP29572.1 8-amino-7-oxononanoate synthase [Lysobacter gummosus]
MSSQRTLWRERIQTAQAQRVANARSRTHRVVTHRDGARCEVEGRSLVNFCGNDYLGLSQHFAVTNAFQDAASREGTGGLASHLVCGHHAQHEALERELADWLGSPRALLFGSGFLANIAAVQGLLEEEDVCVQDRLNHASLIDAARLAGCRLRRYPHADPEGAIRQLRNVPDGMAMLATDGVFSMDGDIAPLRDLALVARAQKAVLYVDDAHGVGVIGPDGRGTVAAARLSVQEVPLQLATFGKALGSYGAALHGDADLIGHLAETARSHLYTTALPPAQAAATRAAIKLARSDHWRREKLAELTAHFRERAGKLGLELLHSGTPIQPVMCGDDRRALAMAQALEQQGYWVAAIRPPTVPEGRARLRVTFSALHTREQVDGLIEALARAAERVAIERSDSGAAAPATAAR